jgi:sugar phosphate isomerase/epimerase
MPREFTLSYLTTAPLGVSEALLLAQRLGYYAIGVRLAPLSPAGHFSSLSEDAGLLRETLACIHDTGVSVFDVEGVRLDEHFRRGSFNRQLAVAAELGAKVISVIGDDPDDQRLIESFGHFCDTAAQHYLAVALEFMPYSRVPDSNAALRILRQAQRPNARIAVDLLHVSRSNMTRADLAAIPQEFLSYAQLCDAPAEVPTTREGLIHTARCARLLPGAGVIDVRGMIEDLPASLPLSVEIPNTEQLTLHGAEEWARRALMATRHAIRNDRSIL